MAGALHLDTDAVRAFANQMSTTGQEMQTMANNLLSSENAMEWISPGRISFDDAMSSACRLLTEQANRLTELSQRVEREVQEWETAAASLSGSRVSQPGGSAPAPTPTPVPTPTPTPAPEPSNPSSEDSSLLEDFIKTLDDLLKPIDWISDSKTATRNFDKALEEIGRMLNGLTGQRGNIKMMSEFGDFLRGTTKGVGFLSNILDLRDMNRYFSGQMTNAEIADTAIKVLFPIPILNDKIADFMIKNMVDPNGHWHGLVTPAS